MFGTAKKVVATFRRSWNGEGYKMEGTHIHTTESKPPRNRFYANAYTDVSNATVNVANLCTEERVHITGLWTCKHFMWCRPYVYIIM